jgi:hypothetical protein
VLLVGNAYVWAGDAEALVPRLALTPKYCMDRDVAFAHGGDQLLVTSHGYGFGHRGVHLYDLATGQLVRQWPTEFFQELGTTAVSPDGRRTFVAASDFGGNRGVVLDPDSQGDAVAVVPGGGNWLADATFFPDNRRLMVSDLWPADHYGVGIVDTNTRRHLATLYATGQVCQAIVSGDGRHVALVLRHGTMELYRQVERESALGLMATPPFWALAASVAGLVASLCRDALRTRRRWGRPTPLTRPRVALATALVTAGGAALLCPFVLATLKFSVSILVADARHYVSDEWPVYLFLLHLLAGLGLITGSRGWTGALVLLLAVDVAAAGWVIATASDFALRPERVFDRMWMLSPGWMAAANGAWALLAIAGLGVLLSGRQGRSKTIVAAEVMAEPFPEAGVVSPGAV